jgi:hypothetical protein
MVPCQTSEISSLVHELVDLQAIVPKAGILRLEES